jgi:NADH:ubiquinone oxidoreductase subunit 6 (subunit J)
MANDLRENKVGRGEFFCYAFLSILGVVAVLLEISGIIPTEYIQYEPTYLKFLENLLSVVSSVGITVYAYYLNKTGDNKDFWYRYFSLGFPIAINLFVIMFGIGFVAGVFSLVDLETTTYVDLLLYTGAIGVWLYFTHKYMRQIAHYEAEPQY